MRVLLVNPPYITLTSVYGVGHQVPFGLLCVGGPLIDAGHEVMLLDAEVERLTGAALVARIASLRPEMVMTGHAGSTPAHPVCLETLRLAREAVPGVRTVYGGVYPTYHAADVLNEASWIDFVVRGEGEITACELIDALAQGGDAAAVPGIAARVGGVPRLAPARVISAALDTHRVGWELIADWDRYQCFGMGRSAIIQFSRGCPHRCSYCGQFQFWAKWRYRDPLRLVDEIEWLHREHGVMFVDLADENPTSSKRIWTTLLQELARRELPVRLFATIRATDIVRDADILPLYRQAGIICILMGIETTDPDTLAAIRKGSTTQTDYEAVRLLRRHGILSMLGHIVGFQEETARTYWRALRQVLAYDPDLLNAMYVTPHRWTDWVAENGERLVIEEDRAKWDYRHQLLAVRGLRPWQVFTLVKLMEVMVQARPRALARMLFHRDREIRKHLRWCFRKAGAVWLREIMAFVRFRRHAERPHTLAQWFGMDGTVAVPRGDSMRRRA
jgi:anaerobic magnesium-protoporphyrin IX monomethyl ester cyclase